MTTQREQIERNRFGLRLAVEQLRRAFDYNGRATRTAVISYWFFALVAKLAIIGLIAFAMNMRLWEMPRSVFIALALAFGIPEIALFVRRLHDQGRTGWLALVGLPYAVLNWIGPPPSARPPWLEIVNGLMILAVLVLMFRMPDDDNEFGPDPRLATENA